MRSTSAPPRSPRSTSSRPCWPSRRTCSPQFRRHGVGSALIEAAVRFAEAHGIGTISTAAVASSRDANRFMARLSFTPQATLRAATTVAVRAKLSARRSAGRTATRHGGSRHIDRVLAARRISRENVPG